MKFHSREAFDADRENIELAVRLLISDAKRRKRFQIATVYDRAHSELVAEVLGINSGPVVAYSARVGGVMANRTGAGSITFHDRQLRDYRMVVPLTGDDGQTVTVMTRSNTPHVLRLADLTAFVDGGARSATEGALTFRRGPARLFGGNGF